MANVHNVDVDRIKSRAKERGLTMKYLCDCLGKHRSFLSCVRNGNDHIDEDELAIIAEKIGTTTAYLTGQTDDPEPARQPEPYDYSKEKQALLELIRTLPEEDVKKINDIVDYVIAKHNKK